MFKSLKERWNVASNKQLWLILLVFALTGSTTVYLKKLIFDFIGIHAGTSLWIKVPVYFVVVLSIYNVLLLVFGFLFGQYRFFLRFEKKFFARFVRPKNNIVPVKLKSER